jgi:hypothetical protein
MHLRLQLQVPLVHIERDKARGLLGQTIGDSDWQLSKAGAKDFVLVTLAGYAAVAAIGAAKPEDGCGHDFDESRTALRAWRLGSLREWKARTVRIMRQRKNLKAVALVADKLLAHTRIGGQHVDMIVTCANGKITPAELAEWERKFDAAKRLSDAPA